ncbi:MAG: asparagine synthase (glutamine-hydrolyzing) [Pyrinomonadaceae bacterium]
MCGIAGIHSWDGLPSQSETVAAMTARLARRGPDGVGLHSEPGIALGHRRLSIIDLSERGSQPMSNEDGTVWLTCNGEIYNYRELRRQLESRGHRFSSDSDSEVLIHLYEDSADDLTNFLEPVRGMFAFAIWDRARQRLVLARDRLGIKPLFYYLADNFMAFASDLDALTACADVPRRVDWTSLYEYLVLLTVPGPNTIYRDVQCLAPGSMLLIERGKVRKQSYWSLASIPSERILKAGEADEALEAILSEAVDLHLVADVEVGAFLSGGVDSGLVTALATEQNGRSLRTFSATFPGEQVDEGPWARDASNKLGTVHTEFSSSGDFLGEIERVVEAMDQPMALTSAVSLFQLSRRAREQVKVVLTGDGGDETFGGYDRHRPYPAPSRLAGWIPEGARPAVGALGSASLPEWARDRSPMLRKAYALSRSLARDEAELYTPRLYCLQPVDALALLPDEVVSEVDTSRYLNHVRSLFESCPQTNPLSRRLFVDLQTSLVDEMLSKVDRMTMAIGLEARVPLLDHRVVEFSMNLASSLKRDDEKGKLPLRRLVGRRLGRETAERAKSGFNSPLDGWLRNDPATRAAFASLWEMVEDAGAFDCPALRTFKGRYDSDGGPSATNLFTLLTFGIWARQRQVRAA